MIFYALVGDAPYRFWHRGLAFSVSYRLKYLVISYLSSGLEFYRMKIAALGKIVGTYKIFSKEECDLMVMLDEEEDNVEADDAWSDSSSDDAYSSIGGYMNDDKCDSRMVDGNNLLAAEVPKGSHKSESRKIVVRLSVHKIKNYDSKKCTGRVGMINMGATCYSNSLMQAFFNNDTIRRYFKDGPETEGGRENSGKKGKVLLAINELFDELEAAEAPVKQRSALLPWGVNEHQDVNEYFHRIFDAFDLEIFKGELKIVLKSGCGCVSEVSEEFVDIPVDIQHKINFEFLPERVEFFCEEHGKTEALKFMAFSKAPRVILINLKRMSSIEIKRNDYCEYPQNFEIALSNGTKGYTLYGVIIHTGTANDGHYYCVLKIKGRWMRFDDSVVIKVCKSEGCAYGGVHPMTGRELRRSTYHLIYEESQVPRPD